VSWTNPLPTCSRSQPYLRGFQTSSAKNPYSTSPRHLPFASSLHADDRSHYRTPSQHPEALQHFRVSEAMPRDAMCDAEDAMALERLDAKYEPCVMSKTPRLCHDAEPLVQPLFMRKSVDTLGCNSKLVVSATFVMSNSSWCQ